MRQNASDLVRRVEAGEVVEITVAGRPAARLVPVAPRSGSRGRTSPRSSGDRPIRGGCRTATSSTGISSTRGSRAGREGRSRHERALGHGAA
ncbi:type II toxin-antitoxin system Phd/YefM family antitoxin [uncultured Friedmanniella sp.]|uniref:type II toxin-antitoxin system Phd/YefM family antitoxin n=1 Tax=uncultured Friedmanniella sp. TaxID=335381 RepID=UPI0035C9EBC8